MAIFSRVKQWVSNEVLTASDLNAEFNNLLNNTKPESIEDYSNDVSTMRLTADPGGVGTESLATSLAGELERLRFAIKRICGAAQWYSDPGRYLNAGALNVQAADIAADAVTTAKILDANVTTAKIADGAITYAKRAAINLVKGTATGAFTGSATVDTDITGFNVTITSTGKPVLITVENNATTSSDLTITSATSSNVQVLLTLQRGTTTITTTLPGKGNTASGILNSFRVPSAALFNFTDEVAAGTYTYKVRYACQVGSSIALQDLILVAREL